MRTREDIEEMFSRPHTYEPVILLEVLLDIRDLLIPLGQTHYTVTAEKINLGELIRKYAAVPQIPSGDVVTTKENQDAG